MPLPFDPLAVETPCFVVDRGRLEENLRVLQQVAQDAGCKILLAQKAFSMFYFYPLLAQYLSGTTASGLYEARLGREEFPGEVHIFSPAYRREEFGEILALCDHIIFNSLHQWGQFRDDALRVGRSCGLRLNPQHSTQNHAIYDPCAPGSRLGVTRGALNPAELEGLEGLHFHTLCQQHADALAATLAVAERDFGDFLPQMKWLNLGGGHHITRADYDRAALVALIQRLRGRYGVQVYLEPGEAVALDAGFLVATVIDLVENGGVTSAILDASAACHMPDVLEMPYRPPVLDSGLPGELAHTYRLTGPTCLAGDILGDYSFRSPLRRGDRLVFGDMAIYSMVKTNTFNGTPLPALYAAEEGNLRLIRRFGYGDFKNRLS